MIHQEERNNLHQQSKEPLMAEFFSIKGGDSLRWKIKRSHIPKMLGSWGLKTLKLCYPYISEIKLGGSVNPDMVAYYAKKISEIKNSLSQNHDVGIVTGAVTVVDEDGDKARQLAKQEVALYLPIIAALDPTLDIPVDVIQGINQAAADYDFKGAAEYIDDNLLSKFALAGTPEDLIEHCKRLIDVGAGRIEFGTPHGIPSEQGIQLLGSRVLPSLKSYISDKLI
jgi:5,10-methylenetetrahydromethanopterin reductase